MESVHHPLQADLQAGEAGAARRQAPAGLYETTPKTPYQRLLDSPDIPEATRVKLRAQPATLDPFELKENIELKLRKFFPALGNLNREATKRQ